MYLTIKHFRYFLEVQKFHVFSDHKPLTSVFTAPLRDAPGRRLRQAQYITSGAPVWEFYWCECVRRVSRVDEVTVFMLSKPRWL